MTATLTAVDVDEKTWDQVIDTNLKGVWLAAQSAARRMVNNGTGGNMVNIASILGLRVAGGNLAGKTLLSDLAVEFEWARARRLAMKLSIPRKPPKGPLNPECRLDLSAYCRSIGAEGNGLLNGGSDEAGGRFDGRDIARAGLVDPAWGLCSLGAGGLLQHAHLDLDSPGSAEGNRALEFFTLVKLTAGLQQCDVKPCAV